jgi:protocatechuate 3,4-dioxygenase beta subunit
MNRITKSERLFKMNLLRLFILIMISFNFILADLGKCQEQAKTNLKKNSYLKRDLQSGKVKLFQSQESSKKEAVIKSLDKLRMAKELKKFKKISEQHNIYERMYKLQKQAEKEQTLKKEATAFKLERIKLFGKPTQFYKAPFVPGRTKKSMLNKALISNVLINGKTHDTISIHDPYTLTFSFAPNFISAVLNVYIDVDNNGIVSPDDILLIEDGLVMDNSEDDEDQSDGFYRITFGRGSDFYSSIESSLIFVVNDFQSISQAVVTVKQKPSDRIILGTTTPPLKNMFVEADFNYSWLYVITDSLGKFKLNVEPGQTQASFYLFDVTGISNGYLNPDFKTVKINGDTTEVNFILTPATAFIEGYVKDQNGNPINNITVQASYNDSKITKTDSTGYYKLGVREGNNYLYLNDISSDYMHNSSQKVVTVLKNSTVQSNFILIKTNSSISGKVSYNSNGIGGIPILVYGDSLNNFILSSADGSYKMPVYKANPNTISYNISVSTVPYGYYVLNPFITGVQPGAVNINFEIMKVTGGIQGRITDSITNEPISNAYIHTYGNDYRSTYSNDSGYYRISLLPGSYMLYVSANLYYQFYTDFYVSSSIITKNISLNRSGSFSGSIKDEEGNPINYAYVIAVDSLDNYWGVTYTYENGNYQVSGLTTSKYKANVTANNYVSQWYNQVYDIENATSFQVTEGYDTPNIDFVLSKGGSISGRVTDKLGKPISEAWIEVWDTLFYERSYVMTNDSGYYSATGLTTGRYYISASSSEYIQQWYNGAATLDEANKVNVVINENTNDINFILTLGSSISGTVKNKNNIAIQYAGIFVFDSTLNYINYASTNDSGYYIVKPLPANKKFFLNAYSYGYTSQWYNNVSTADSATPIILQEEENRENIDFILSKGGILSGRVLSITGSPLEYTTITVEKNDGSYFGYGYTDYQGYYSVSDLPQGDYYAKAENYLYEEQWYFHKTSKSQADLIPVKMEDTTENINFDLTKINEGDSDSLIITIDLANIPDTLIFSQSYVDDYYWEYMWGVSLNADGIDSTGENGCELEICLYHYKLPGELPFQASIIQGTLKEVIKWDECCGYTIYTDFPVRIDDTNKNSLIISLPTRWNEINNINDNTKYFSDTHYYTSDGVYQDKTNMGYGGKKITDPKGDVKYSFIDIIGTSWQIKKLVDVSDEEIIPKQFSLFQNYPNPFNPTTTISFDLPERSKVQLKIFNILGEEVKDLINEERTAGHYNYNWNANGLASGVYFYKLQAGDFVQTKKLILIK